jgi:formylglycine-generating enzyme required for sulfatase activity
LPQSAATIPVDVVVPSKKQHRRATIGSVVFLVAVFAAMVVRSRFQHVDPPPMPAAPKAYEAPWPVALWNLTVVGEPVELDAASSRSFQNLPFSSRWELVGRPAGSRARLGDANTRDANTFVPDVAGDYKVTLVVHDGAAASPFEVTFTVPKDRPRPPPPTPRIGVRWDRRAEVTTIDLRWVWLLAPPVAGVLAWQIRRYWQRRKILDRARADDFKRRHTIKELTLQEEPGAVARVRAAIQALRRPFEGADQLDVPRSVLATVRAGLYPTFVQAPSRRRAEYLILIDTLSSRDHQSALFQRMVLEMHRSGLQVDAYLFAGDPRVCRPMPEIGRRTANVMLTDLVHKAAGARLLVFGDGNRLVYEESSVLQPWTEIFHGWPERALITPKRAEKEWSPTEEALSKLFLLLPASVESLKHFIDRRKVEASFEAWEPGWQDATAGELREALGAKVYRWLAACALYPRLEWVLTQRLGRALGVYTDEGLLRLIRLPWFRRGEMPVELQDELVESMTGDERRTARDALVKLLEEARVRGEGGEGSGFEIAVQELDLKPGERQQLKRDMAVARDAAKRDPGWLLWLPRRLRSLLFADSTWLVARSLPVYYLAGALLVVAGIGALGGQGFAEITQRYVGPTVPGRHPFQLEEAVHLVRFSGDGTRVAAMGESGRGAVWSRYGEWLDELVYAGTPKQMAMSADGTLVTVGGSSGVCTLRVGGAGRCFAKLESGELLSGSVRRGLVAVGISNSTLNSQDTLREVAQFPARDVKAVLWSSDDGGWFQIGGGVEQFRLAGTRITVTKHLAGTGRVGLDWRGQPAFGLSFVAGGLTVAMQGASLGLGLMVGSSSERRELSSRATAVEYDPVSNRIAVGLEEGRIEFMEARLSNRVNPADGLEYAWIPPGRFLMGCSPGDVECNDYERPAHPVEITRGFWMGRTEVTQAAYRRLMGINPSYFKGEDRPVETITWDEAKAYCEKAGGRLPTGAEWEYAARGGTTGARYGDVDAIAWHHGNSGRQTHPVGIKEPNRFGLYDMIGNVWEWTADWSADYQAGESVDPKGPASGSERVLRGGGWDYNAGSSRASNRGRLPTDGRLVSVGCRCAWEP